MSRDPQFSCAIVPELANAVSELIETRGNN